MIKHLTFKEYVESKQQLIAAVANVPVSIIEYEVYKYCNLTIGDSEDDKMLVALKPKHKVIVEWSYANPLTPVMESMHVEGAGLDPDADLTTFWSSTKLQKWLIRHTNNKSVRT